LDKIFTIAIGRKILQALKYAAWLIKLAMKTIVHRERSERKQPRELSKGIKIRKFRMLNLPRRRKSE